MTMITTIMIMIAMTAVMADNNGDYDDDYPGS